MVMEGHLHCVILTKPTTYNTCLMLQYNSGLNWIKRMLTQVMCEYMCALVCQVVSKTFYAHLVASGYLNMQ